MCKLKLTWRIEEPSLKVVFNKLTSESGKPKELRPQSGILNMTQATIVCKTNLQRIKPCSSTPGLNKRTNSLAYAGIVF